MGSEDGELYVMQEGEDGEWVSPTPARSLIVEAITDETDLDASGVDDLGEYVDLDELRDVLEGDADAVSFEVEDVGVTVDEDGNVEIE